jgi:cobalt ECF transporter T component CbiQ
MRTAPDAPDRDHYQPGNLTRSFPALRRLWLGLAALLICTPLGILATGSAWGEWTAKDFSDADMRRQIAAASGQHLPPVHPPQGLERLSTIWTAPLSRYAPGFIRSPFFGYLVSAMVGVGLIILILLVAQFVLSRRTPRAPVEGGRFRRGFIEATVTSLMATIDHAIFAEELARVSGFLQRLDPRVKVAGLGCLVIAAAAVHRISALIALIALAVLLAVMSHVPVRTLLTKIWTPALSFSGVIAIPAIFITPGIILYRVPLLDWSVTQQGLTTAALLILRVETAATFSALLILTTEWTRVLKALRFFHFPVTAVVILGMTYRYVFVLLRTAAEMFESRRSRLVGTLEPSERRRLAAASVGVLLSKSFQLSTEVHSAMCARGYQGEVYLLDDLSIQPRDWMHLSLLVILAIAAVLLGR